MAKRWTAAEEAFYRNQLRELYINQNKTIDEIGDILQLAPATIFQRLKRLAIIPIPERKLHYLNRRDDIHIPSEYSPELAEFFGIMLGDGCLSHFQVSVTLGIKELSYAKYVAGLLQKIFGPSAKIITGRKGYRSLQEILVRLGYRVSAISGPRFYMTKIGDIERFFDRIMPQNEKHKNRYAAFLLEHRKSRAGSPVGCGGGL